jgi:hypothetical protein
MARRRTHDKETLRMTKYAYALPPRGFGRRAYVVVSTEDQIAKLTRKTPLGKVEMTEAMTFERLDEALKPIARRGWVGSPSVDHWFRDKAAGLPVEQRAED